MKFKKNYYEVLKVSPLASPSAIKKSYRKLVKSHHPDKNPGNPKAEEVFKEINSAYEVLSDTFKRKDFDRQLKKAKEAEEKSKAGPSYMYDSYHTPFERPDRGVYSSPPPHPYPLNNQAIKNQAIKTQARPVLEKSNAFQQKNFFSLKNLKNYFKKEKTSPLQICGQVEISLEEAGLGCQKKIPLQILRNGVLKQEFFTVHIPSGTKENQKIKVQTSGKSDNLYVSAVYKEHSLFKADNENILMDLPVPWTKAILGGIVEIPTLRGKVSFHLPAGTASGFVIQLKGQGFPISGKAKKRGNMLVTLLIDVPSQLSEEEKNWIKHIENKNLLYPKVAEFDIKAKLLLKKRNT